MASNIHPRSSINIKNSVKTQRLKSHIMEVPKDIEASLKYYLTSKKSSPQSISALISCKYSQNRARPRKIATSSTK